MNVEEFPDFLPQNELNCVEEINRDLVVLRLPFAYWLIKKFNSRKLTSPVWMTLAVDLTLTPGLVSRPLDNSPDFPNETRQFEKNEENRLPAQ